MPGVEELIGRRVSLRHRVGDRDGRPLYSDAVGELARSAPGQLTVHTRRGPVRVREDAVVAVRAVPPPVPRRPSWAAVAALESGWATAWPAMVDRPLGAWRMRAAGGSNPLANATLATGDPGMSFPAALAEVRRFAAEQGIPARVRVPTDSPWESAVLAAGWKAAAGSQPSTVQVLVGDLAELGAGPDHDSDPTRGEWRTPDQDLDPNGGDTTPHGFPRAGDVAVRAAVVGDHLYLALLPGGVLSRAVLAGAARWGRARGARWGVLQLVEPDEAARAAAADLSLRTHHRVRYLAPGSD